MVQVGCQSRRVERNVNLLFSTVTSQPRSLIRFELNNLGQIAQRFSHKVQMERIYH
jgi:hypothetical protein